MRRLRWTSLIVVLLVVVGLAVGGWYYTDELLPAPVPGDPDYDVAVVASHPDAGEITLAVSDGDLVDLDRIGFWTATGALELGAVTATAADTVTRSATLLSGDWPTAGDVGASSTATFRGDPGTALGLEHTTVSLDGPDGVLPAWRVPAVDHLDGGATWVVLVHGRGSSREEMHRALATVHDTGLDALVISVRNDPDAPADPRGWGRYGDAEWVDLQVAVDHLVRVEGAERLIPVGASQGGSLVLSWLRRGDHTERATAAVLISPLTSMQGTLELAARDRGIPEPVIGPLLWSTGLIARARSGLDLRRLEHGDPSIDYGIPMLLTHGTVDATVPFEDSLTFVERRGDLVTFEVYEGVGHVREWNADPDRFDADLAAFLDEAVARERVRPTG